MGDEGETCIYHGFSMSDIHAKDHAETPNQRLSPTDTTSSGGLSRDLSRQTTNPEYGDLVPDPGQDGQSEKTRRDTSASRSRTSGRDLTLTRTVTRRETVLSRIRTRPPIGIFSHPLEHQKTTVEDLVDFDGLDDPYRPLNWAMKKKVITTALYGFTTMTATWASSAYSPGTRQVAEQFGVGMQTATLGTTLFLFAFGIGPLLWAPLSEVYGRKNAVLPPMFLVWYCGSQGHPNHHDHQVLCRILCICSRDEHGRRLERPLSLISKRHCHCFVRYGCSHRTCLRTNCRCSLGRPTKSALAVDGVFDGYHSTIRLTPGHHIS